MTPSNASGNPSRRRSQPRATSSSSVTAGEVRHSLPWALNAAHRNSASTPGPLALIAK